MCHAVCTYLPAWASFNNTQRDLAGLGRLTDSLLLALLPVKMPRRAAETEVAASSAKRVASYSSA